MQMCRSACAWRRRSRPRSPPTSAPMCSRSSHPAAIRCARAPPFLPQGGSALFQFLNTSKRSLVLDLKTDAGRAGLARLLDKADACLFEEPAVGRAVAARGPRDADRDRRVPGRNGRRGAAGERARDPGAGRADAHGGRARAQAAEARRPSGLLCRGPHRLHRPCRRAGRTRGRPARACTSACRWPK